MQITTHDIKMVIVTAGALTTVYGVAAGFWLNTDQKIHELKTEQIQQLQSEIENHDDLSVSHAKLEEKYRDLKSRNDLLEFDHTNLLNKKWEEKYNAEKIKSESLENAISSLKSQINKKRTEQPDSSKLATLRIKISQLEEENKKVNKLYTEGKADKKVRSNNVASVTSEIDALVAALDEIHGSNRKTALLSAVPGIKGGVSAEEMGMLLGDMDNYNRSSTIVELSKYIKRPISKEGMSLILQNTTDLNRANAVKALTN